MNSFFQEKNPSIKRFEQMLKTNKVLFFDGLEFESIILHYIDLGKFNLAKKALAMGMDQHPKNIELMLLKTEILLYEGAYKDAEELLVEIEILSPENEEIYVQRASIYSKKKKHLLAINLLCKALTVTEDPAEIYNLIGSEYLFMNNFKKAKGYFMKCMDKNQDDYQSLYNLLYCYEKLKQKKEAIVFLRKFIDSDPYNEIAWHQLGKLYMKSNDFKKAMSSFDFSIISNETYSSAYIEKGKLLEKIGRTNEAIQNYEMSSKINNPNAFISHRIGLCHLKLGNYKLAVKYFKESIHLEPNHEKSWIDLISIFQKNKELLKSQFYVKKSLEVNGDSIELWKKSAEINFKIKFYEEVCNACKNIDSLGTHSLKTWKFWFDAMIYLKNWDEAYKIGLKATKSFPNNSSLLLRMAGCKIRLGKKEEGHNLLRDTIKRNGITNRIKKKIKTFFPELLNFIS
ncbi:MAG: tetratricopeptide repeat protein [Bacteroidota bacterium]|nr:tetratricopeptide repeat protein [Bacteroidota bacterium]